MKIFTFCLIALLFFQPLYGDKRFVFETERDGKNIHCGFFQQSDRHGDLPFHHANRAVAKWMIKQDPQLLLARNDEGRTPCHLTLYSPKIAKGFPQENPEQIVSKIPPFPLINPGIIADLSGQDDLIVSINFNDCQRSNRYFHGGYPYQYIGTTDNGLSILRTQTGLLIVTIEEDTMVASNNNTVHWGNQRTLIKRIGEIPLEPSWAKTLTIKGNILKLGSYWDIDLSLYENKKGKPLKSSPLYSFEQKPFIAPKILHTLTSWCSDGGDQVVAMNVSESQNHPQYLSNEDSTRADLSSPDQEYSGWSRPEYFSYNYLGKDENSNVHFLETHECTGGMATFVRMMIVMFEEDEGLEFDMANKIAYKKPRILLKKLDGGLLSDRNDTSMELKEGLFIIRYNPHWIDEEDETILKVDLAR